MHASMLADVENLEVKPKGSELAQQWIDKSLCQPLSAIRHQARPQHDQIGLKFRRPFIGVLNPRALPAALQAMKHIR